MQMHSGMYYEFCSKTSKGATVMIVKEHGGDCVTIAFIDGIKRACSVNSLHPLTMLEHMEEDIRCNILSQEDDGYETGDSDTSAA